MQIVIDIPEEDFDRLKKRIKFAPLDATHYETAIANGTPLPEHHSDLIERDAVCISECNLTIKDCAQRCTFSLPCKEMTLVRAAVNNTPTIIPAMKEGEDYTTMVMSQGKWRCTQCNELHFNTKTTKPIRCFNCGRKVKEYIK